tara:strand:+ start:202 stop:435 length:234 start_codon:yes stop_codon:yes gene_type:complete
MDDVDIVSIMHSMISQTKNESKDIGNYRLVFDSNGSRVRMQMRNGTYTYQVKTSVYQKDRFLKRESQQETNRRTAAI